MPTITLDRKVLDKILGKKLPDDKLKERIAFLGTDLEELNAKEIIVEIFPSRPDMLSEQGFARALSSFIGNDVGLKKYSVKKSGEKLIVDKSVLSVRPYTACAIVKGLKFDDAKIKEIINIQEKLHVTYGRNRKKVAIGVYPLEKIKFPIKFVGEDPNKRKFMPLEFGKEITGMQVLSMHPTGREYGHLLEGCKVFPFFVDADDKVLSMPPVINSHDIGKISSTTKDVFIECSGFDRKVLEKCLNMIVSTFADMGGELFSMDVTHPDGNFTTPNLSAEEMKLDISYVNKRLGLELKEKDVKELLGRMGYGYVNKKVLVPAYRADILHQIDLIEDIAIAYGYENFTPEIPKVATIGKEDDFEIFKRKISEILVGLGLLECKTYNISSKESQGQGCIELANALNKEFNVLRKWLIPDVLDIFKANLHNEYPQNVFLIGSIFKKGKSDTGVVENDRLCVGLCSDKADFTAAKQVLDYLFKMIGLEYSIEDVDHDYFVPGRVGRVVVGGKKVAYIGEIHPAVLERLELQMPVAVFELNLSEFF